MIRIAVFRERPECMTIYSSGEELILPPLRPPFTLVSVAEAVRGDVSVFESTPGRWTHTFRMARAAEKATARQRSNMREATAAALARQAPSMSMRERGELLERKQTVDARLRKLTTEYKEAKRRAFLEGKFMPREKFLNLERKVTELKDESQAIQSRLTDLKKEEAAARPDDSKWMDTFKRRLRDYLDEDEYEELVEATNAEMELALEGDSAQENAP